MNAREVKIQGLVMRAALLSQQISDLKEQLDAERGALSGLLSNDEMLQFGCLRVHKMHVDDTWVERHLREGGWQVRIRKVKEKEVAK